MRSRWRGEGFVAQMRIGVVFPQTEIGGDVGAVRAYGEAVEELGYAHLLAYDHVLGADPAVHEGWAGPYDVDTTFHEPFVLFGYLAGDHRRSSSSPGSSSCRSARPPWSPSRRPRSICSPTGGFRLGVGIGWNAVEYEALGKDFADRGRRLERADRAAAAPVDRADRHPRRRVRARSTGAGLAPLPVQRPIPIWIGGASAAAYRRGRSARPTAGSRRCRPAPSSTRPASVVEPAAAEAGRDPATIGMEGRVQLGRRRCRPGDDHAGRGATRARRTSRSTRWALVSPRRTTTLPTLALATDVLAPLDS